jgi:hypothetical protein
MFQVYDLMLEALALLLYLFFGVIGRKLLDMRISSFWKAPNSEELLLQGANGLTEIITYNWHLMCLCSVFMQEFFISIQGLHTSFCHLQVF